MLRFSLHCSDSGMSGSRGALWGQGRGVRPPWRSEGQVTPGGWGMASPDRCSPRVLSAPWLCLWSSVCSRAEFRCEVLTTRGLRAWRLRPAGECSSCPAPEKAQLAFCTSSLGALFVLFAISF